MMAKPPHLSLAPPALIVALLVLALAPAAARAEDRHYLWVFAAQARPWCPAHTHTWATFARVGEGAAPAGPRPLETFTISWMPATLKVRFQALRPEPGVNLDLLTSFQFVQ